MSYSSENDSSPEISVDCIQLIVGTFSNVSLDSFFKIEQDIYIGIYIYIIYIYIGIYIYNYHKVWGKSVEQFLRY